jgi:hypothetical protein
LLPAALTILITLQTVEIPNPRMYDTYVIAFGLLAGQGLISLVRWWMTGGSLKMLARDIRLRMPEKPGIPEQVTGFAEIVDPERTQPRREAGE